LGEDGAVGPPVIGGSAGERHDRRDGGNDEDDRHDQTNREAPTFFGRLVFSVGAGKLTGSGAALATAFHAECASDIGGVASLTRPRVFVGHDGKGYVSRACRRQDALPGGVGLIAR
jgi:hypothetical protein